MTPHDLTRAPATDPLDLYRWRDGLYAVDLLTAALSWLDLFTILAGEPADLGGICRRFGLVERPAGVMLTLFKALGLLREEGGRFSLTEKAREHLVRGSPFYLGPYYDSLRERPVCKDLLQALRTGKPARWGSFRDEREWARAMEDEVFAAGFTAAMDCRGVYLAQALWARLDLEGRERLLDIAGGSGVYAASCAARHPALRATVLEKPPVDRVARTALEKRGFTGRVSVVPGDMLREPLPGGYDLHLLSNVLHDWDVPMVKELLGRSYRALEPGGMLIVHDAFLDEEKSGPLPVAMYSVLLMHSTDGRCYSTAEMRTWLEEAGFRGFASFPTAADRGAVTARKER